MLSSNSLKEFAKKFQTIEKNVVREYIQHLFLSYLYQLPEAEKLLFKGGTALRAIFNSPRFSEDLDFTGEYIYDYRTIETLFITTLSKIEAEEIDVGLKEAKPTTGGYLGIIHYELHGFTEDMNFEISLRKGKKISRKTTTIVNDYTSPYVIISLSGREIVNGKMNALLDRKKPRDYYDLYFCLRHPELHKVVDKNRLKEVLANLEKEKINFKKELSILLPVSHQLILRNFKSHLKTEIKKFVR